MEKFHYDYLVSHNQREVIKRRALDLATAAHGKSMVVFLDKTARPLVELLRSGHHLLYPTETLPAVRFVNIGSEKRYLIRRYLYETFGEKYREIEDIERIKDMEELSTIFRQENIDYLVQIFKPSYSGEQRLIVDDVVDSGATRNVALKVLSIIDSLSQYSFFPFLELDSDCNSFRQNDSAPFLPWHSKLTLIRDKYTNGKLDDKSFQVQPEKDPWIIKESIRVRKELSQCVA